MRFLLLAAGTLGLLGATVVIAENIPSRLTPHFVEVGKERGLVHKTIAANPPWNYIIDNIGTGVALFDYDLDGDLDLYQVQSSALSGFPEGKEPTEHLYRNDGSGNFEDVTGIAMMGKPSWGFGAAVGDYDNDGDPDLLVTNWGANRLYRNEGDGTFSDVAGSAGLDDARWGTSAAFFDYNNDALLDLYINNYIEFDPATIPGRGDPNHPCNFRGLAVVCGPMGLPAAVDALYKNNGDGTFTEVSAEAGLVVDEGAFGLGVVTADLDNDGDSDIFVANDSVPNYLYLNDGKGHFTEEALFGGVSFGGDGRAQAGMGCDFGDPDGDGDLDLFVTNFSHDYSTLYQNDGAAGFEDVTLRAGLLGPMVAFLSWGTAFIDFDNDSDEDLFIANSHVYFEVNEAQIGTKFLQRNKLFINDGKGKFTELPDKGGPALEEEGAHRGAAFGDVDNDGDVDVAVSRMFDTVALLENRLPAGHNWIRIRLAGTASNRDGVGARISIHAGGRRILLERKGGGSFESASDPRMHIGLGSVEKIELIEVRWPSGSVDRHKSIPANQTISLIEDSGLSPAISKP